MNHLRNWALLLLTSFLLGLHFYDDLNFLFLVLSLLMSISAYYLYYFSEFKRNLVPAFFTITSVMLESFMPGIWINLPATAYLFTPWQNAWPLLISFIILIVRGFAPLPFAILIVFSLIAVRLRQVEEEQDYYFNKFILTEDNAKIDVHRLKARNEELIQSLELNRRNDILQERNRIAREIHDNVGHKLSSAILQVAALEILLPQQEKSIKQVHQTLDTAMEDIRNSVHQLHDDSLSFRAQIEKISENYSFCPIHTEINYQEEPSSTTYYALVLLIKEALSNTQKHSDATRVDLHFIEGQEQYQLLIKDNGSPNNNFRNTNGLGIISMEERIRGLGGKIHIHSENGFRIFVEVPKLHEREKR